MGDPVLLVDLVCPPLPGIVRAVTQVLPDAVAKQHGIQVFMTQERDGAEWKLRLSYVVIDG